MLVEVVEAAIGEAVVSALVLAVMVTETDTVFWTVADSVTVSWTVVGVLDGGCPETPPSTSTTE